MDKKCECPILFSQKILAGKWKLIIIYKLMLESQGFNSLQRKLGDITPATLSNNLKELAKDGLVDKKVESTIPPKVTYSLTKKALSMSKFFEELMLWGNQNIN
jgi:DNA-binding HxlR family transcriptional regulator